MLLIVWHENMLILLTNYSSSRQLSYIYVSSVYMIEDSFHCGLVDINNFVDMILLIYCCLRLCTFYLVVTWILWIECNLKCWQYNDDFVYINCMYRQYWLGFTHIYDWYCICVHDKMNDLIDSIFWKFSTNIYVVFGKCFVDMIWIRNVDKLIITLKWVGEWHFRLVSTILYIFMELFEFRTLANMYIFLKCYKNRWIEFVYFVKNTMFIA